MKFKFPSVPSIPIALPPVSIVLALFMLGLLIFHVVQSLRTGQDFLGTLTAEILTQIRVPFSTYPRGWDWHLNLRTYQNGSNRLPTIFTVVGPKTGDPTFTPPVGGPVGTPSAPPMSTMEPPEPAFLSQSAMGGPGVAF